MSETRGDPRRALQVTRYHTWPRLRDQSVGEHSAQVQRILLAIWPEAPRHVIIHCLVHDVGEERTGDPPYPVKKENPEFKRQCDRIEYEAHLEMCLPWGLPGPQNLAGVEYNIFKMAEFIEMWEWALYEQRMGNTYAALVETRCWDAIAGLMDHVGEPIRSAAAKYISKRRKTDG